MSDSMRDLVADPALLVSVEAALNLIYGEDPYRPDINEIIGSALTLVIADTRDRAEDMAQCNKHDDCVAKAVVLHRLVEYLETGISA